MDISLRSTGSDPERIFRDAQRSLEQAARKSGRVVARVGVKAIKREATSKRGSMRFGRGKLNVRSRVRPRSVGSVVELYGTPAGAWTMADSGTKAHGIKPRRGRALHFGGDEFAASAQHPGTRGSHIWTKTRPGLERALEDELEDHFEGALL